MDAWDTQLQYNMEKTAEYKTVSYTHLDMAEMRKYIISIDPIFKG